MRILIILKFLAQYHGARSNKLRARRLQVIAAISYDTTPR